MPHTNIEGWQLNHIKKIALMALLSVWPLLSQAKLDILTTTTNLRSLVDKIGGDRVKVESLCKGTQDPHYIEAKPSYMLKASRADLLVSVGLELEIGWLPLIVRGARNPKIKRGNSGHFVAGDFIKTLERPTGTISRADGDIHSEGNPHFLLDPQKALIIAERLKDKLSSLDKKNSGFYTKNYQAFFDEIHSQMKEWKKRVKPGTKVITYHKTLTYFLHQFDIENVSLLEPKPGIPPTARHILSVMKIAKEQGVRLALIENYFDPTVAHRITKDVKGLKVTVVPVSVGGEPNIKSLVDLYERLIHAVENTNGNN